MILRVYPSNHQNFAEVSVDALSFLGLVFVWGAEVGRPFPDPLLPPLRRVEVAGPGVAFAFEAGLSEVRVQGQEFGIEVFRQPEEVSVVRVTNRRGRRLVSVLVPQRPHATTSPSPEPLVERQSAWTRLTRG